MFQGPITATEERFADDVFGEQIRSEGAVKGRQIKQDGVQSKRAMKNTMRQERQKPHCALI